MQHIEPHNDTTAISSLKVSSLISKSPPHLINTNNNLESSLKHKDQNYILSSWSPSSSSSNKSKVNKQHVSTSISMGNKLIQNVGSHIEKSNSNDLEEEGRYLNTSRDNAEEMLMPQTTSVNGRSADMKMSPKVSRVSTSSSNLSSSSSSSTSSSSNSSPIPFNTKLVSSPTKSSLAANAASCSSGGNNTNSQPMITKASIDETSVVTDSGFTDAPTTSSSCSSELSSCGSGSESHSAAEVEFKSKKSTKKSSNNTSYSSDTSNSNLEQIFDVVLNVDSFSAQLGVEKEVCNKNEDTTLSTSSIATILAQSSAPNAKTISSPGSSKKRKTKIVNDEVVVTNESENEEIENDEEDNENEEENDDDENDEEEEDEEEDEYEDEEIGGERFKLLVQRKVSKKNSNAFLEGRLKSSKGSNASKTSTTETATKGKATTPSSSTSIVPYASMTTSSISYNNNNSEFSSEFAIPPRLEYLLDMPMCSYETQVQHSWNPDDRSLNIFVKEADPLTLHRHPVAQSTDCIRTKMGEKLLFFK